MVRAMVRAWEERAAVTEVACWEGGALVAGLLPSVGAASLGGAGGARAAGPPPEAEGTRFSHLKAAGPLVFAAGAARGRHPGAVWVFERSGGGWAVVQTLEVEAGVSVLDAGEGFVAVGTLEGTARVWGRLPGAEGAAPEFKRLFSPDLRVEAAGAAVRCLYLQGLGDHGPCLVVHKAGALQVGRTWRAARRERACPASDSE